jgi:hypothetical protein
MAKKKRNVNPKSPWRQRGGGLGPLSYPTGEEETPEHIPGVLDKEFFETPSRLTHKELSELL